MKRKRRTPKQSERLAQLLRLDRTWGDLERDAGIECRALFWRDKTQAWARAELQRLIEERFDRGEIQ